MTAAVYEALITEHNFVFSHTCNCGGRHTVVYIRHPFELRVYPNSSMYDLNRHGTRGHVTNVATGSLEGLKKALTNVQP
jgi:hypothetical protein